MSQGKINKTVKSKRLIRKNRTMKYSDEDRKESDNSISDKNQKQVIRIEGKPMFKIVED